MKAKVGGGGDQLHFKKNLLSNLTFELTFEHESNLTSAISDVEVLSKKAGQIYIGGLVHVFFSKKII